MTYSHIRICNILFLLNMLYNILLHGVDTGRYNITIENDSQLQQSLCTFIKKSACNYFETVGKV